MKLLNLSLAHKISGGELFALSTSIVDTTNIPASCIERFFNGTIPSSNLIGLTDETLIPTLTAGCVDYVKPKFPSSLEADLTLIDLKIIEG